MTNSKISIIKQTLQLVNNCRYFNYKMNTSQSLLEHKLSKGQYLTEYKKLGNYLEDFDEVCPQLKTVGMDYFNRNFRAMASKLNATVRLVDRSKLDEKRLYCRHIGKIICGVATVGLVAVAGIATAVNAHDNK